MLLTRDSLRIRSRQLLMVGLFVMKKAMNSPVVRKKLFAIFLRPKPFVMYSSSCFLHFEYPMIRKTEIERPTSLIWKGFLTISKITSSPVSFPSLFVGFCVMAFGCTIFNQRRDIFEIPGLPG